MNNTEFETEFKNENYYLIKNNGTQVEEIRRKVLLDSGFKYILDSKQGVKYVTENEFNTIPNGYRLVKFD